MPLDDVDCRIIAELTRDGRMSVTQVAENVHISRVHAYTRIAYVTLKVSQHSWRELREQLRAIPEVHHMPGVLDTQTFLVFEDVDTR